MISTFALICLTLPHDVPAKDAFFQTLDCYSKLNSFSADLEHDFSSGLFPGKYHQHLEFKKEKGFKLIVTGLKGTRPEKIAPDYYCDGKDVTTTGGHESVRPINTDPNTLPGYEVSGGIVMSWLLDSHLKTMFVKPPGDYEINLDWGKRTEWQGQKVKEVVMSFTVGTRSSSSSYFIDPEHKHVIGAEWTREGKTGTMVYKNQKDNPEIDPKVFVPPTQ